MRPPVEQHDDAVMLTPQNENTASARFTALGDNGGGLEQEPPAPPYRIQIHLGPPTGQGPPPTPGQLGQGARHLGSLSPPTRVSGGKGTGLTPLRRWPDSGQEGKALPKQTSARTRIVRWVLILAVFGFAVHILLPQLGQIGDAIHALRTGRWPYLGVTLAGAVLTYVAAAWTINASIPIRLPFFRTMLSQVAASVMAVITPAGVGWVGVTDSYLQKAGAEAQTSHTATSLSMLVTFLSHLALLAVLVPLLPTLHLPSVPLPSSTAVLDVSVVALVVLGIAFWVPKSRRAILRELAGMVGAVPAVLGNPGRTANMIGGAFASNLAFGIALIGSVAAFGPVPSLLGLLVAYMVAATIAAISPTPGGVGAMEAALVAALVRLGVASGPAVAAALTFRLATFWLPIPLGAWALREGRRKGWL